MADRSVAVGRTRHVRHTRNRGLLRILDQTEAASRARRSKLHRWLRQRGTDLGPTATTNVFTVVNATDIVTLDSAHGLAVGTVDGPYTVSNSGGALPAGLVDGTPYWFRAAAGADGQLFYNREDAELDQNAVDMTDDGTGTQTIVAGSNPVSFMELFRQKFIKPVQLQAETDLDNLVDDLN